MQQVGALEALRSRAGMLLAVASLATSFLGGLVLQDDRPRGLLAWLGVGSFVGLVALTLVMLLPFKWVFSLAARRIIGDYIEAEPADLATTLRELALHLDNDFERNPEALEPPVRGVRGRGRLARCGSAFLARHPLEDYVTERRQGGDQPGGEKPQTSPQPKQPRPDPQPSRPDPGR